VCSRPLWVSNPTHVDRWPVEGQARRMSRSPLYDRIGVGYDDTRHADPELVQRHARHLRLEHFPLRAKYLDLACGTGNYAAALAAINGYWTAVDTSPRMLAQAAAKAAGINWMRADAAALPCRENAFAGAICTLAIHHFEALEPVFAEARRVVAGAGRLVLFTSTREQMQGFWLNHYFPRAMERTIQRRLSRDNLLASLKATGWHAVEEDPYEVAPDLQDHFTYSGKHTPSLYLDKAVRAGMSTFSAMAVENEVQAGCEQLAADIDSGTIDRVVAEYAHDRGDYLFIVAE
jgi:ubiquinone/menaquinone biosynthesis C-methylase UbiE